MIRVASQCAVGFRPADYRFFDHTTAPVSLRRARLWGYPRL